MTESNILVRLKLLNEQFDKSIQQSQRQIDVFKGVASSVTKVIGRIGLAFGTAEIATESFKRVIGATQAKGDTLNITIGGLQSGLEHLFQTIATGDWSNFLNGFETAIQRGREYAALMDELGDRQISFSSLDMKAQADLQEAKMIVSAASGMYSKEEIAKAQQTIKERTQELIKASKEHSEVALQTSLAAFRSMSQNQSATLEDLEKYIFENQGHRNAEYEVFASKMNALQSRLSKGVSGIDFSFKNQDTGIIKQQIKDLEKRNPQFAKEYYESNSVNDKEREKIISAYKEHIAFRQKAFAYGASTARLDKRAASISRRGFGGKASVSKDIDAFAEINAKIRDFEAQIYKAPEGARRTLREQISRLEKEKFELSVALKYDQADLTKQIDAKSLPLMVKPTILQAQEQINAFIKENEALELRLRATVDIKERTKIKSKIEDNNKSIGELKGGFGLSADFKPPKPLFEGYKETVSDIFSANLQLIQSFGAVGESLASIAGESDNALVGISRWLSGTMSAIGQAIPAISTLIALKKAKTTAEAKEAAVGAGASVASIPVAGPILAVSAIASVVAALASIPKFERGGIVGGTSYHGDRIWARLNSGEMVLNKAHQRILDNHLSSSGGGQVEFKIRGQELVGVLNKFGRSSSRT